MSFKFTFLGTSTSVGIPVIGCDCHSCTSIDPKNHRMRASAHLQTDTHSLLIDSGPDLRQQALAQDLRVVDAVLYTHCHLDHVAGFDELRAFCWRSDDPLPLYGTKACLDELARIHQWAFSPDNTHRGYIRPQSNPIQDAFQLGQLTITPLPVQHATVETIGYRFDQLGSPSIAYIPDAKIVPQSTLPLHENLDHFIIDGLRETPHPTHMSIPEACAVADLIKPKQTWLTHISHEIDYTEVAKTLPSNVDFAYDGLTIGA